VRVIDIEMEALELLHQPFDHVERRKIAEHRVKAVDEVPDAPVTRGETFHLLAQVGEVAVAQHDDRYRVEERQRRVHARMGRAIDDDRVSRPDEEWERRLVGERRRGSHDGVIARDLLERALKARVQRRLQVDARVWKLRAIAADRVDHAFFQLGPLLEVEIAAAPEVEEALAVHFHVPRGVLPLVCGLEHHACVRPLGGVGFDGGLWIRCCKTRHAGSGRGLDRYGYGELAQLLAHSYG
jgi:hypothetical protein